MTTKLNRRENLRLLAKAMGGMGELAKFLDKSPSQLSHLIGVNATKNIGDRLAAYIERAFGKPPGWLDMDHTEHVDEVFGQIRPPQDCYRVPLLHKSQIIDWILQNGKLPAGQRYNYVYTSIAVSSSAYATRVPIDSMEAPNGVTFPQDALIIVDPALQMKNGSFVLLCLEHDIEPTFRQLKHSKGKIILSALNPRYPDMELPKKYLFCGIVRQVLVNAR